MSFEILTIEEQGEGNFNGGAILEKKPIPFYHETNGLKPYSNLFYWAHAWSEKGSTIGLHPHQGFEIMSFVLKGSIKHYDTKNQKWLPLNAGDVQIIRAGNGISHSEHIEAGGEIFQIWFDPNLHNTLSKPASYDDYPRSAFPVVEETGIKTVTFKGDGSPLKMETENIHISEKTITKGTYSINLNEQTTYSIFVLEGELMFSNNTTISAREFIRINDENELNFTTEGCKLFMIKSPSRPTYKTYYEHKD